MSLYNPGDVQVSLIANLNKLTENDLLQHGLHYELHGYMLGPGAPVLLLEHVEEDGIIDCGAGHLRHVESVSHSCF